MIKTLNPCRQLMVFFILFYCFFSKTQFLHENYGKIIKSNKTAGNLTNSNKIKKIGKSKGLKRILNVLFKNQKKLKKQQKMVWSKNSIENT